MTSADQLKKHPDLFKWWSEVANDPRFDMITLIANADIVKMGTPDKISGATEILESLKAMTYIDPRSAAYPTPGTIHEFSKG